MWNSIKYLPLEWRARNNYCVPKGPDFNRARAVTIPIGGSLLRFKAPHHSPSNRHFAGIRLLPGRDALEGGARYGGGMMANDFWGIRVPFARDWAFWGPWMTGCKAQLGMSVTIVNRQKNHAFPNISFFNPRAFEMVLANYLNDRYGHRCWDDIYAHICRYQAPVEWRTHDHRLPVPSASFTIFMLGYDGKSLSQPIYIFAFPIADEHFVEVAFRPHFAWANPAYDATPVRELQEAIFDSITLKLSPEAQASYDKVKAECPDMRLTSNFPPLKWPTPTAAPEVSEGRLEDHSSANGLPCHRGA